MGVDGRIDYQGFNELTLNLADTEDDVTVRDTSIATTINTDASAAGGDDSVLIENASAGAIINLGPMSDLVRVLGGQNLSLAGGDDTATDKVIFDISATNTPTSGAVLGENAGGAPGSLDHAEGLSHDGLDVRLGRLELEFDAEVSKHAEGKTHRLDELLLAREGVDAHLLGRGAVEGRAGVV